MSFYQTKVEIEVLHIEDRGPMSHVIMQLHFDNKAYASAELSRRNKTRMVHALSVDVSVDVSQAICIMSTQI